MLLVLLYAIYFVYLWTYGYEWYIYICTYLYVSRCFSVGPPPCASPVTPRNDTHGPWTRADGPWRYRMSTYSLCVAKSLLTCQNAQKSVRQNEYIYIPRSSFVALFSGRLYRLLTSIEISVRKSSSWPKRLLLQFTYDFPGFISWCTTMLYTFHLIQSYFSWIP
jgi:hypothetical protein